ncbi:hypothetical protein ACE5SX_17955, partial [Lactiplantibacillus plantarum]
GDKKSSAKCPVVCAPLVPKIFPAKKKKTQLPQLLSREDLKIRWQMNSRQSVHQVASKSDFPQPVFAFNHGKTPLYLDSEIQIFEINHPRVLTPSA